MRVTKIKSYVEGDSGKSVSRTVRNRAGGSEHRVSFDDGSVSLIGVTITSDGDLFVQIKPENAAGGRAFTIDIATTDIRSTRSIDA